MSVYTNSEERVIVEEVAEEIDLVGNYCRVSGDSGEPVPTGANMEAEKRIRREIANSNERRRMQSINAGFQSLRTLLPHHEGEKLSKAAILQQTAEYIYSLEQEKTRLLSQNCQLKRLVNQHEGGEVPPKKRKAEIAPHITTIQTISESSDEGVGSMSPEPVTVMSVVTTQNNQSSQAELLEIKAQLERERRLRMMLEDQLRSLETQVVYPTQLYQTTEEGVVVSLVHDNLPDDMQVMSMDAVPPVAQTQTVVSCSPPISRSPSPQRLPSALEAAIKAEPKVEVERVPSPGTPHEYDDMSPQTRLYVANTSRQNLETIVEAIRHLEGDHLFAEEPNGKRAVAAAVAGLAPAQDVPLALTTKPLETSQRLLQVEMNPFLQFHTSSIQHQQQSRPGVIVVKQHS